MKQNRNELTKSWPDELHTGQGHAPLAMPRPGDVLAERFLLIDELGRGGSGTVYSAHDRLLNLKVALKVIYPTLSSPATMERLRREVRAARSPHPNAAAVHDLHTSDGYTFLAMELVDGVSLRDRLESGPALPVDEAVDVARQAAAALAHLHAQGLIHRDVKPGNLLVTPGGRVKLCDMGLVRALASDHSLTETSTAVGTPAYMAPEQATGEELTAAVDVYGLGLTLWQCLTGEVPLRRETAVATLMARQRSRPRPVRLQRRDCPRWLDRLVRWMLEPEPRARPTAAQVETALSAQHTRRRIRLGHGAIAAGAVTVALITVAVPVVLRAHHGEVVRTEVSGSVVEGVDAAGHTAWHRDLGRTLRQPVAVDLDGDGVDELALLPRSNGDSDTAKGTSSAALTVLDLDGHTRLSATPARLLSMWSPEFDRNVEATIFPMDLNRDGRTELAVLLRHRTFFPSGLVLYWPAEQRWEQVLYHSGHIRDVVGVPGDPPRVRFLAYANRLGMLPVVGEIEVSTSWGPSDNQPRAGLQSPEIGLLDTSRFHWSYYTLLRPASPDSQVTSAFHLSADADGGSSYHFLAAEGRVDALGNPVPGPNAGRDLRTLRRWFLQELAELRWTDDRTSVLEPERVREAAAELRERGSALLAEEPYRVLLGLAVSRALARAGDVDDAVAQLRRTAASSPYEEVVYRLAHLTALSGDLDGAVAELARPESATTGNRAGYDSPLLSLHIAMEARMEEEATRGIAYLMTGAAPENRDQLAAAFWAEAHLWWDQCTAADTRVRSWAWAPDGAATACLARWRSGTVRADDPERMEELAHTRPQAAFQARIARGAAQLGLHRPGDALATLAATAAALEPLSRDDFLQHQLYDLARALRLEALAATGERARARREARALLRQLTPGVLPAILTREVASGATPPRRR